MSWTAGLQLGWIFIATFFLASWASLVVYWFGRWKAVGGRIVTYFVSTLVCVGAVHLFFTVCATDDMIYALLVAGVIGVFSAAQASMEQGRAPQEGSWKRQFARSFVSYLCSVVLSAFPMILSLSWRLSQTESVALNAGYFAGILFAPLSISFYRWMLPNLQLRPGIERSLSEEEHDEGMSLR